MILYSRNHLDLNVLLGCKVKAAAGTWCELWKVKVWEIKRWFEKFSGCYK